MTELIKAFIIILALTFYSCTKPLKNVNDYFPQVKMTSVLVLKDGAVQVTGEVLSSGKYKNTNVSHVGFCVSEKNNPTIKDEQISCQLSGSIFTATYPSYTFQQYKAYYFASWATNEYGYGLSEVMRVDSIPMH